MFFLLLSKNAYKTVHYPITKALISLKSVVKLFYFNGAVSHLNRIVLGNICKGTGRELCTGREEKKRKQNHGSALRRKYDGELEEREGKKEGR